MTKRILVTIFPYMLEAAVNILSCSQLDGARLSSCIDNDNCLLIDRKQPDKVIRYASQAEYKKLYTLQGYVNLVQQPEISASIRYQKLLTCAKLWHRRLGNASMQTVQDMAGKCVNCMNLNLKGIVWSDTCLIAKQGKSRSNEALIKCEEDHTINSDVVGPVQPQTPGMSKHIVTFLEEKSRFAKIFTIRNRTEVKDCLLE